MLAGIFTGEILLFACKPPHEEGVINPRIIPGLNPGLLWLLNGR